MAQYCNIVLVLLVCSGLAHCRTYNISSSLCIEATSNCLTLSQFAANSSQYLDSDTTLTLMEGNHSLSSHLLVRNITSFRILPVHDLDLKPVKCKKSLIYFQDVDHVHLQNLKLEGCQLEVDAVRNFLLEKSEVTNLTLSSLQQSHSFHRALLLLRTNAYIVRTNFFKITVLGQIIAAYRSNVTISESLFEANIILNSSIPIEFEDSEDKRGSMIHIAFDSGLSIIKNSIFYKNNVYGRYSVIIDSKDNLIINNSTFYNNTISNMDAALVKSESNLTVNSCFMYNNNNLDGKGGAMHIIAFGNDLYVHIHRCRFANNHAANGGAIYVISVISSVTISDCVFTENIAGKKGGGLYLETIGGTLNISGCTFDRNYAQEGGAANMNGKRKFILTINTCHFIHNIATYFGGALYIQCFGYPEYIEMGVIDSNFINNTAQSGGAMFVDEFMPIPNTLNSFSVNNGDFMNNTAKYGGGIFIRKGDLKLFTNDFVNNQANSGGAIFANDSNVFILKSTFNNNTATNDGGAISTHYYLGFSDYNYTCNISECDFHNNKAQLGGAVYTDTIRYPTSVKIIIDCSNFTDNDATNGGALLANFTKVHTVGLIQIVNNTARNNGGGIYLYWSELKCQNGGRLMLLDSTANENGGGIFSANSSLSLNYSARYNDYENSSRISFIRNKGRKGGALYLQNDSMLYILDYDHETVNVPVVTFVDNSASYGNDVFVFDDNDSKVLRKCFIQSCYAKSQTLLENCEPLLLYFSKMQNKINVIVSHFDLCTVDKVPPIAVNETKYFKALTNLHDVNIGSLSLRLCFCKGGRPDCNYTPPSIDVPVFTVEVALVDQFNHAMNANIEIDIDGGVLPKQQRIQRTKESCTSFHFKVFSSRLTQELAMSPSVRSPYYVLPNGNIILPIKFQACISCPVGFEKSFDEIKGCSCICDTALENYITSCNASIETVTKSHTTAWIGHINRHNSSGYLIHPYCPLDYCLPPESKVEMNLNTPSGVDAQCAHDRAGLLCGVCKRGLSLSLGSKRCLKCPTSWPGLLVGITVGAFLAGMFLVAILLILNLTVAVGTLNGLIFYVNIVGANSSTFFPSSSFIAIFIAWMNLDLGIDTCFFVGMDAYWKTWIELAFPTYVIFLLIMIIIISERSLKFARLIGRKNPVATLDTLILLSYVKFIRIIISSYSFAILDYPDQSREVVWLPDASISYFSGKHIILLIVATLILLVGIVYTTLLFLWQWLLRHQDKKMFRWILKYQRLRMFIEPFHAPFSINHRYWTGLLLFVRATVYVTSAVTSPIDSSISLMIIGMITTFLLILMTNRLYNSRRMDYLEVISIANTLYFCVGTMYFSKVHGEGQAIIAYISGSVALVLFVIVLIYHLFTELIFQTKLGKQVKQRIGQRCRDTDDEFCEDICSTSVDSVEVVVPTQSVVDPPSRKEACLLSATDSENVQPQQKANKRKSVEQYELNEQTMITPYRLLKSN